MISYTRRGKGQRTSNSLRSNGANHRTRQSIGESAVSAAFAASSVEPTSSQVDASCEAEKVFDSASDKLFSPSLPLNPIRSYVSEPETEVEDLLPDIYGLFPLGQSSDETHHLEELGDGKFDEMTNDLLSFLEGKENETTAPAGLSDDDPLKAAPTVQTTRRSSGVLTPRNTPTPRPLVSSRQNSTFLDETDEKPQPENLEAPRQQESAFSFGIDISWPASPTSSLDVRDTSPRESLQAAEAALDTEMKSTDDDPFRNAYDVWRSKGLMGRASHKAASPRRLSTAKSIESQSSPTTPLEDEHPPIETLVLSMPQQQHSNEIDNSQFSDTLHQWQERDDHLPNGHFLSPPPDDMKLSIDIPNESFNEIHRDTDGVDDGRCTCSTSIFSGNDDLVDFFLPKLGMACMCGKQDTSIPPDSDPLLLKHVLRQWQVEFLHSSGIHKADEYVKVHHRSAGALAKALRKWRKQHAMAPVRTVSCGMALHIWSRTCKVYVRSVRKQLAAGNEIVEAPNVLEALSAYMGAAVSPGQKRRKRRSSRTAIEPESQAEV